MKMPTKVQTPEEAVIALLFHFTVLIEYQLLDLVHSARKATTDITEAITHLDSAVGECQERLKNSLAPLSGDALDQAGKILSHMSDMESQIRSHVFSIISNLSFEDIQSQRIEHLLNSIKLVNTGISEHLHAGLSSVSACDMLKLMVELAQQTRRSYTMREEREIFDQVFIDLLKKGA